MDRVIREVLGLLVEDYYGPWEIAIQVPADRQVLARTLGRLIDDGLVEWYVRESDSASAVPMTQTRIHDPELADDATWEAPALTARSFLLGPTQVGEDLYFNKSVSGKSDL